ncbi:PilZ domain-containing protein [Quadrisphaera sp. DSM 44207]|uniref:PilZ domain-containing protein n=1 Tax=Quadrisphaera sp. DSM 44207 TaxID=1881057 RepID=UPI000890CD83|nr:PilZ domain-containing protein [Quadrisphaera sp. DSM 44207]SDQ19630.1 c-di-GMP-binding flagellar brake protein YcgR, contains PilZNR and PilZ domains [Quadrisphaera sp. DSM 44207]
MSASAARPHLPHLHDAVSVVDAAGRTRPSRVEALHEGWLAVAAPGFPGGGEPAAPGEAFDLVWPTAGGALVVQVLLRQRVLGAVPVWWVQPVGDVVVHQRRSFVRAPAVVARTTLTWLVPFEGTAQGDVLDLSEGGMLALVTGWGGGVGSAVVADVVVGGERQGDFALTGTVLRATERGLAAELAVQFHQPVPGADEIRGHVFAWERRYRRRA